MFIAVWTSPNATWRWRKANGEEMNWWTKWLRHILALSLVVLWSCAGGDDATTGGDGAALADSAAVDSTLADSARADSALAKKKADAIPVEIAHAEVGTISSYLVFNSTVETEESVQVFPQISGLV